MRAAFLAIVVLATSSSAAADDTVVISPVTYTWMATGCADWPCALAAVVEDRGKGNVIALPTPSEQHPWVLMRKVEAGSIHIPEDEPFECTAFDSIAAATAQLSAIHSGQNPFLITIGQSAFVVSLREEVPAKRRRPTAR